MYILEPFIIINELTNTMQTISLVCLSKFRVIWIYILTYIAVVYLGRDLYQHFLH